MIPTHPRFTLFPYTTLFRSDVAGFLGRRSFEQRCSWNADQREQQDSRTRRTTAADAHQAANPRSFRYYENFEDLRLEDRKSTRLNSSHRCISYAVFCLKKKK